MTHNVLHLPPSPPLPHLTHFDNKVINKVIGVVDIVNNNIYIYI